MIYSLSYRFAGAGAILYTWRKSPLFRIPNGPGVPWVPPVFPPFPNAPKKLPPVDGPVNRPLTPEPEPFWKKAGKKALAFGSGLGETVEIIVASPAMLMMSFNPTFDTHDYSDFNKPIPVY